MMGSKISKSIMFPLHFLSYKFFNLFLILVINACQTISHRYYKIWRISTENIFPHFGRHAPTTLPFLSPSHLQHGSELHISLSHMHCPIHAYTATGLNSCSRKGFVRHQAKNVNIMCQSVRQNCSTSLSTTTMLQCCKCVAANTVAALSCTIQLKTED